MGKHNKLIKWIRFWAYHFRSKRPRRHSPAQRGNRRIWAAIALALLLGITFLIRYQISDNQIRVHARHAIEQLTGGSVEIDQASFSLLVYQQIRIKGLRVYLPDMDHNDDNLVLSAQDVILEHNPLALLRSRLQIEHIIADHPYMNVVFDLDQQMANLQKLVFIKPSKPASVPPSVTLRQGMIRYQETKDQKIISTLNQPFSGTFNPLGNQNHLYKFHLITEQSGTLNDFIIDGVFNRQNSQIVMDGSFNIEAIDVNTMPSRLSAWIDTYKEVSPSGDVKFHSIYDPQHGNQIDLKITNGELQLPAPKTDVLIPLTNLDLDVVFTNDMVTINHITCHHYRGCDLYFDGTIKGYSKSAQFDLGFKTFNLDVPDDQWDTMLAADALERSGRILPVRSDETADHDFHQQLDAVLKNLPPVPIRFIDWFHVTNTFDVDLRIKGQFDQPKPAVEGRFICKNTDFLYKYFPYPVPAVSGEIKFNRQFVTIGPLTAEKDGRFVNVTGTFENHEGKADDMLDLVVKVDGLPLSDPLRQALDNKYKKLWDFLSPSGRIDVQYLYNQPVVLKPDADLIIDLRNTAIVCAAFPMPVSDLTGRIKATNKLIKFDVDHGKSSTATLTVNGTVENPYKENELITCDINLKDVTLDEAFIDYIPSSMQQTVRNLNLSAISDGSVHLVKDAALEKKSTAPEHPAQNLQFDIDFDLHDGKLTYTGFPYPMENVAAKGRIANKSVTITKLTGQNGNSDIQLQGLIEDPNHYNLTIQAQPLDVTDQLNEIIAKKIKPLSEQVIPSGTLNLALKLNQDGADKPLDYNAKVEPLGGNYIFTACPYPLNNVRGNVLVQPGLVFINELSSLVDDTIIDLTGTFDYRDDKIAAQFDVDLFRLPLTNDLLHVFPEKVHAFYTKAAPTGKLNADLSVKYLKQAEDQTQWDISGPIHLDNVALKSPFKVADLNSDLDFVFKTDPTSQLNNFKSTIYPTTMKLQDRSCSDLTAQLIYDPNENTLHANDISGELCKGRIAAELDVTLAENSKPFLLQLQFLQADLNELFNAARPPEKKIKNIDGLVNGWLSVGRRTPETEIEGNYYLSVQNAVLGQLPLVAQLLHVINLKMPRPGAFNNVDLSGTFLDDTANLEFIHLWGSAMSLSGVGTIEGFFKETKQTDAGEVEKSPLLLAMIFVLDPPDYLDGVPVIGSFLRAIRPELMQLRVSGTFDKPLVETVALPAIGDTLEILDSEK